MNELIALVERNSKDWIDVESVLGALNYQIRFAQTLEEIEKLVEKTDCLAVILDLDIVEISNRFFRAMKKRDPDLTILTASSRPFHPELKEAMTHHICACFRKPIETEEIEFWLKTVKSRAPARDPTSSPVP